MQNIEMTTKNIGCGIENCIFGNNGDKCTHIFKGEEQREHLLYHIKNAIPAKITYEMIDLLPQREDFLNKSMVQIVDKLIDQNKPLLFTPNDICEKIGYFGNYEIHMAGITMAGSRAHVILKGIPIYIDLLLGPDDKFLAQVDELIEMSNVKKVENHKLRSNRQFETVSFNARRIYFDTLQLRETFINIVKEHNSKIVKELSKNREGKNMTELEAELEDKFAQIETSSDAHAVNYGRSNGEYFKMMCRTYLFRAHDWNTMSDYKVIKSDKVNTDKLSEDYASKYVFEVDISKFKKFKKADRANLIKALSKNGLEKHIENQQLIEFGWDIETYSFRDKGEVPRRDDVQDWAMICIAGPICFYYSDKILMNYAIVDVGKSRIIVDDKNPFVIECKSELEVIMAFADLSGNIQYDFINHFNGGSFDWPCLLGKLEQYNKVEYFADRYACCSNKVIYRRKGTAKRNDKNVDISYFTQEQIKVTADTTFIIEYTPNLFGAVDSDGRALMMQHYQRAENTGRNSLNYFLEEAKLDAKADMPYHLMFAIYKCYKIEDGSEAAIDELLKRINKLKEWQIFGEIKADTYEDKTAFLNRALSEITYYCRIDSYRVHQLYLKMAIIQDKREMSNLSYVPIKNSIIRSNGNRIINFTAKYCAKDRVAFTENIPKMSDNDKKCGDGGKVFPPIKGHNDKEPVSGLDFASLYPSIMQEKNLSKESIIYDKKRADELAALGYKINTLPRYTYKKHTQTCECHPTVHDVQLYTCSHNGILSAKQTAIIEKYEKTINWKITNADGSIQTATEKYIVDSGAEYVENFEENIIQAQKSPIYTGLFIAPEIKQTIEDARARGDKIDRKIEYKPVTGRAPLANEMMGVNGKIMYKLFHARVPIKKIVIAITKLIAAAELAGDTTIEYLGQTLTMNEAKFLLAKYNAKQSAIKVMTNSFYGQANNFRCCMYELGVGPATTACGRDYITKINKILHSLGCKVYYGDTDSQYTTIQIKYLNEIEDVYLRDIEEIKKRELNTAEELDLLLERKKKMWYDKVQISFREIEKIREVVNDYLISISCGLFMSMSYEEVAFPYGMFGKKKYYFVEHIDKINFYPHAIKMKGIDIIKQGKTDILRELGTRVIKTRCLPENEKSLHDLILNELDYYYTNKWELSNFLLKNKYKKDKQNVRVQNFVKRMRQEYDEATQRNNIKLAEVCEPPEHGCSFSFYYVVREQKYDEHGRKIKISQADKMMFTTHYDYLCKLGMEPQIDYGHYISDVISVFARLISDRPEFQPSDMSIYNFDNNDSYTQYDKYCVDKSTKYLEEYCKRYQTDKNSKKEGNYAKSLFRAIEKQTKSVTKLKVESNDIMREFSIISAEIDEELKPEQTKYTEYLMAQFKIANIAVNEKKRIARENRNQSIFMTPTAPNAKENNLSRADIDAFNAYTLLSSTNKYFNVMMEHINNKIEQNSNMVVGSLKLYINMKNEIDLYRTQIINELRGQNDKMEKIKDVNIELGKLEIEKIVNEAIIRDKKQDLYTQFAKINENITTAKNALKSWKSIKENKYTLIKVITDIRNKAMNYTWIPEKSSYQLAKEEINVHTNMLKVVDDESPTPLPKKQLNNYVPPDVAKIQYENANTSMDTLN